MLADLKRTVFNKSTELHEEFREDLIIGLDTGQRIRLGGVCSLILPFSNLLKNRQHLPLSSLTQLPHHRLK